MIRASIVLPALLLLAAATLGWNLRGYRLFDPDEGRNAEVAREMAQSNDYVVPHLNGLPYLDKPIAYFATAAVVMEVLGPTELAARLPAYAATLGTIALLCWFARRRFGATAGWIAGIAYATMPFALGYAHVAMFDSLLTLCTTAALLCFFEEWTTAAWVAMGVGALAKGPIALAIPLVAMVSFCAVSGSPLRRLVSWRGMAAFALVALPWFVAVTRQFPEFPTYAFVLETFKRFTTSGFHRTAPVWYYLPIVPLAAFPWIVPACAGIGRWRDVWAARREPSSRELLWLACWVLAPLVLLTLNHSKLPQYVLPLMPAFALAAARAFSAGDARIAVKPYVVAAAALAALFLALPFVMGSPIHVTPAERDAIPFTSITLGGMLLASAACVLLAARRASLEAAVFGYAAIVLSLPFSSAALLRAVGEDRSAAGIAAVIAPALPHGGQVVGVAAYPPSLPFYLGRTVTVATTTATELTSNYIATYQERYRAVRNSPLRPLAFWRAALEECPAPTVFVTRLGDGESRRALDALPLLGTDEHYAVYGPCPAQGNVAPVTRNTAVLHKGPGE